jgi:hypothetical protein
VKKERKAHEIESEIGLKGLQVKTIEAARRVAAALEELEGVAGIRTVKIVVSDFFVCPDITEAQWAAFDETRMQRLLRRLWDKERP